MCVKPDGQKVRAMRTSSGRNAGEFSREAGISATTLRAAERGAVLRLRTARKIGAALDVDPRSFATAVSSRPA